MSSNHNFPRLIADIGGTNARFCIETARSQYEYTQVLPCKNFSSLAEAISGYLKNTNFPKKMVGAAIALPTPEVGDTAFMVNSPWQPFSLSKTREEVAIENFLYLNDFHALALALPFINAKNLLQVGGISPPDTKKPIALIGPGTGLGMATLIKHPIGDYYAIPSEGCRSSFPPVNEEEFRIWQFIHARFHHVSVERLLSGPGIQLIYEALCFANNTQIKTLPSPAEITSNGINGSCWTSKRTLDTFCAILGTVASNLAVTVYAFGGVYIGGGIIPKMLDYFIKSEFRCRFEDKGRFRPFLVQIPVYVITDQFPAFLGASYALNIFLTKGYIP